MSQIGPFSRCTSIRERVFRNGWSPVIVTTPTWSHRIRANYDRKTVAPDVEYCTFIMISIAIFVTLQSFSVTCASNELGLNYSDFNIYYENYISENEIFEDRKTRRNDFVPFNSLTFKAGGVADEKYKSRLKSKETNEDKTEWWRKTNRKKMKKKKHKKESMTNVGDNGTDLQTKSPSYTLTTLTTTTASTTSTWYPPASSTSNYFSRPLDYQKPNYNSNDKWWKGKRIKYESWQTILKFSV